MRLLTTFRLAASVLLLYAGVVSFKGEAQTKPILIPRQIAMPDYVLAPGDQMVLHVIDMEEISDKPLRIDSNGFIDLPLIGRLHASGLTLEQLKDLLRIKLDKYITAPQVSASLTEDQGRPVSVLGEVNSPGVHQLHGPQRLIEALSIAGGTKADAGPVVIITRQTKWGGVPLESAKTDISGIYSTASLSLDDLMSSVHPTDNILIQPDDIISIPKAEIVYVVGNVKKAGGFQLNSRGTLSVLQAVSLAEGLSTDAASSRAKIIRPAPRGDGKPKEIPVNVAKVFEGSEPDVPMYANDVLFIPNSAAKSTMRRSAEAVLQVTTGMIIYRH